MMTVPVIILCGVKRGNQGERKVEVRKIIKEAALGTQAHGMNRLIRGQRRGRLTHLRGVVGEMWAGREEAGPWRDRGKMSG